MSANESIHSTTDSTYIFHYETKLLKLYLNNDQGGLSQVTKVRLSFTHFTKRSEF